MLITPFFSIILPTFNRRHLIKRAISSVLAQSFTDFELIIIDDGSQDDTFSIVRPFVEKDRRLRYHHAANRGLAMARNLGITMSAGASSTMRTYITYIDSDDEYLPEHLTTRANYLTADPAIELLHGGVEVIGEAFVADKDDPSRRVAISDCVVGGTFFLRHDLIKRIGGYREVEYGDDADLFERAQAAGVKIVKVNDATYRYYRTESDSLCSIAERSGIDGIIEFRKGAARLT
jgi:glycosyltransferase involved in cell wall biosynthesis